jgi:hypothetical protein
VLFWYAVPVYLSAKDDHMHQTLSLAVFIAVALVVQAQTGSSSKANQTEQIGTAKQQVLRVLTVLRQNAPSPRGWVGHNGPPTRAEIDSVVADDYFSVDEAGQTGTKREVLQKCCSPEAAAFLNKLVVETQLKVNIKDVNITTYGDTAIARYRNEVRLVLNGEPVVKTFNATEVLAKRDGRWQSLMHTETVIPGDIVAAKINPKIFDDYVGKYQLTPTIFYTVRREGDKLLWESDHSELVPESETTFLKKNGAADVRANRDPERLVSRIIFVRDDQGHVTHIRIREYPGVEYSATKLE